MATQNADLSVACLPSYLHEDCLYSNIYRANFAVGGTKQNWDIEQFIFPLEADKASNLFKRKGSISSEDVKLGTQELKTLLNREIVFQKSLAEENKDLIDAVVQYLYINKEGEENCKYYFLSYPKDSILKSPKFFDASKGRMNFVQLLQLSKELFRMCVIFNAAGKEDYSFSTNNLVVCEDKKLRLRFYNFENERGFTKEQSAADLIWNLATGGREYFIDSNSSLNEYYPAQFVALLKGILTKSGAYLAERAISLLDKLLSDIRIGVGHNFYINFSIEKKDTKGAEVLSDGTYKKFSIKEYLDEKNQVKDLDIITDTDSEALLKKFNELCLMVKETLDQMDANEIKEEATLDRQRKALMGHPKEVEFYKARINEIITKNGLTKAWKPKWYSSITEAVYGEILGFSGVSNWLSEERYKDSISCKIIGDRIYYKGKNGHLELQPQRINKERRDLLKRTLLLIAPQEPLSKAWHEIYTVEEHLRVTIYNDNGITKRGEDVIIFRRYVLKDISLDGFIERGSFPKEVKPLLESMIKIGYNVCFTGPVESAKSTFLQAYQKMEDPSLEAVSVETDDETQYHLIMPKAPIIQFVPSQEQEDTVIERIKRSDADYIVIGEARNGKVLKMAVDAANMGSKRMKMTFHNTETVDLAYDIAEKISSAVGGDIVANMIKVAKTFQYIFVMSSLPKDRTKKRLKGLWEMEFDSASMQIIMTQIGKYIPETKNEKEHWVWNNHIGADKEEQGMWENPDAYLKLKKTLAHLANISPNNDNCTFKNPYMDVYLRGGGSK